MFTERPIVPRCGDGMPRVFAFHRSSRAISACYESCADLASFQQRVEALANELCCGPCAINLLVAINAFDDSEPLELLTRAIDTKRCDVLIVESLDRISREPGVLHNFLSGLGQTGVRLVAIDDRFDSAMDGLPMTFALSPAGGSVPAGAVDLNGCT